jgi:hypothetical protein
MQSNERCKPKASHPLRLKHHRQEHDSKKIHTRVRRLQLKISLQPQGQTRILPHNITHCSVEHGVESSEVDVDRWGR